MIFSCNKTFWYYESQATDNNDIEKSCDDALPTLIKIIRHNDLTTPAHTTPQYKIPANN